jgi:hypothetical protein
VGKERESCMISVAGLFEWWMGFLYIEMDHT